MNGQSGNDGAAAPGGIPVIDVSGLRCGNPGAAALASRQIGQAARKIGFFCIVNHGLPRDCIDAVFAQARQFFELPPERKADLSVTRFTNHRGYAQAGDEYQGSGYPADVKESFDVGQELRPDDPDFHMPFMGSNPWPDIPGFREALLDYYGEAQQLVLDLHRAVAVDLGVTEDYFTPHLRRGLATLRLLRYPPHPVQYDGVLHGANPHTDWGNITLLAQDNVGGLEVQTRDGDWLAVPSLPGAFVCNIGDCLMRWSNDIYRSTPHRVVNRQQRERFSVVFFGDPNGHAPVDALPTCVSAQNPRRYPATTYEEYLRRRFADVRPAPQEPRVV